MGLCRVHPISYIILIFVSRIVNQQLSYALPLQSIIDFPDMHPSCGSLACGGLYLASPWMERGSCYDISTIS